MKAFRIMLALTTVTASALVVGGSAAAAAPTTTARSRPAAACTISGTFNRGLTITSNCTVPSRRQLKVRGTLKLASGAQLSFADGSNVWVRGRVLMGNRSRINAITASTVTILGNVLVGRDATLGLGCSLALTQPPDRLCKAVSHDVVMGSILAWGARSLLLDNVTIRGNVVSVGGGSHAPLPANCIQSPTAVNFVFKDNVVFGQVFVTGWRGCWLGLIRNVQHGSMVVAGNRSADPDSTEIVSNRIWGQLACFANTPAAQIGDSGGKKNTVYGLKLGECAAL